MKGRLEPFVGDIDLETLATAKAAHSFYGINLGRVLPVSDLYKCIMKGSTILLVSQIDVDTSLNQESLGFKSGIRRGT